MYITRELAQEWIKMTPVQRSMTGIPEYNFDVVKAFAEGKVVLFNQIGEADTGFTFKCDRDMYTIVEPKWEPKGGDYAVDCNGRVLIGALKSKQCQDFGSEFETREATELASKHYRIYHRLYKLAEELNGDWKPDWNDPKQNKFGIFYNHKTGKFNGDLRSYIYFMIPYFSDLSIDKAIEIMNLNKEDWLV